MRRPYLLALPGVVLAAGSLAGSACGGRLRAVPEDGGNVDVAVGPPAADAGESSSADSGDDGFVTCSYDASDEVLCTPPADDLLFADPPAIQVAAGSYGAATFVATGPWASDPSFFMWYDGSTLPILNEPQVETYGTPQSIAFLVPASAAGAQGTFTVKGHAGNIERVASVQVTVTSCKPWPASTVCPGQECGYQGDGCGGLLSCGECSPPTGYCWIGQCVGTQPTPCPGGEGFDPDAGACIPCSESAACNPCPTPALASEVVGQCISADSLCICYTTPKPPDHTTYSLGDAGSD